MDFFGDYSIETASCHPSSLVNHTDDVFAASNPLSALGPLSPRDTRTSYPVEFANMSNLARAFGLQNLETPSIDSSTDLEPLHSSSSTNESSSSNQVSSSTSPRTPPCWRRRIQRQRDMYLQADPSHLRSISELVERMVDEGSQCETTQRPRNSKPSMISIVPANYSTEVDEEDSECSDLASPRSLSGSSSNGRSPGYFEPPSPAWRRGNDYTSSSVSKDGRIQKSRSRKSPTRERR